MANIKKRTFIVFSNKEDRKNAIDFLLKTNTKFTGNVNAVNGLYWISTSPKTFVKSCLDLYLNNYLYSFTKIYK